MHTSKWAKEGWIFLHAITLHYPNNPTEEEKQTIKLFFENLKMPCDICMANYVRDIKKFPLTSDVLSSKKNLVKWLILIHNETNKSINKPEFTIEQTINFFKKQYDEDISSFFSNTKTKRTMKLTSTKTRLKTSLHYIGMGTTVLNPFVAKIGGKSKLNDSTSHISRGGCCCGKRS